MKKTIRILLFAAIFVVTAVVLCACGKTKIDLKDYVSMEASGFDGYGTVTLDFNYDELGKALGIEEEIKKLEDTGDFYDAEETVEKGKALYQIKCHADKSEKLKNKDKIKITFEGCEDAEEILKAAFSNTEFTYTVEGLEPLQEIDPFEEVTVSREKVLYGSYAYEVQSPEQYEGLITYTADIPKIYTTNSVITVTYEYDADELGEAGYVLQADAVASKEFPIEGVDLFVESFDDIGEESLAEIKDRCISVIKEEYFGDYGNYYYIADMLAERRNIDYGADEPKGKLVSDIKYEHGYFKINEQGNEIALVFSFQVKDRKVSTTVYAVLRFDDVIRKESGEIYVTYDTIGAIHSGISSLDVSMEEIENDLVTNNEFEKVE